MSSSPEYSSECVHEWSLLGACGPVEIWECKLCEAPRLVAEQEDEDE